jgi:hypothetical protein
MYCSRRKVHGIYLTKDDSIQRAPTRHNYSKEVVRTDDSKVRYKNQLLRILNLGSVNYHITNT